MVVARGEVEHAVLEAVAVGQGRERPAKQVSQRVANLRGSLEL